MSAAGRFLSPLMGLFLGGLVLVASPDGALSNAHATTIYPLTVDQMVDASDLIVRGVVSDTWTTQGAYGVATMVTLDVSRTLKGAPLEQIEILVPGGELDGVTTPVEGAPRYGVGEDVLVLLTERHDGSYLNVGLSLGKYSVKQNPADGEDMVVRFFVSHDRAWDYRFLPNPPVADRVSFATIEAQITDRVKLGWDGKPIPGASLERLRAINNLQSGVR